jgi:hypothetical protein
MTEAQVQKILTAFEGMRQQFSTFAETVLLELEAERRRTLEHKGAVHGATKR